jgi:hypothetical protein
MPLQRERAFGRALTEQLKAKSRGRRRAHQKSITCDVPVHGKPNDLRPTLELVDRAFHTLVIPKRNVRSLDVSHVAEVEKAIAELGFDVPVLIDEANEVLDGVVRVEAAKRLGIETVPRIVARHLTPKQKRLLRVAANRLVEKGTWALGELKIVLEELIVENVPLDVTGFSLDEIDHVLLDDECDTPEIGPLEPYSQAIARRGDIFVLGQQRLMCGDARRQSPDRTALPLALPRPEEQLASPRHLPTVSGGGGPIRWTQY